MVERSGCARHAGCGVTLLWWRLPLAGDVDPGRDPGGVLGQPVVGVLTGGLSSCDTAQSPDYYGRLNRVRRDPAFF